MMISDVSVPILQEVYVAGIPEACVEQEFRDFFAQYGNVTSTKLSEQSKNGTRDLFWAFVFFAKSYQLLQRLQKAKMSSDQACSIIFIYCHGVFLIFGTTCFWCLCSVMITAWSCGQMPEIARIRADKFEESAGSGFRCHRLHQDTTYLTHHHYLQALLDTWHVAPSLQSWLLIALGTPNQCKAFDGASSSMRPAISQH